MPNISTKPTQLPEDLGMYVDVLRERYRSLHEVWVLGPRVNEPDHRNVEWDLLVFGDAEALHGIRSDASLHRDDVNLMVVVDGSRFEKAWGDAQARSLSDIEWRREDAYSASYAGRAEGAGEAGARASAVRVR